jgi:hypothetical protein
VVVDGLLALPRWLLAGVGLGIAASLAATALFVVADRMYPSPSPASRRRRDEGESRRRTEIRAYLDAIDERYAENHPVDGQQVAFYLPERDVAITFDARAYYRIERSNAYAVLVEHEMPGLHLGSRLPFEVPDVSVGTPETDRQDPIGAAFAELGVPVDADLADVRAAYRQRVKETHPDQGGDEEEFKRVREAYTTVRKYARSATNG